MRRPGYSFVEPLLLVVVGAVVVGVGLALGWLVLLVLGGAVLVVGVVGIVVVARQLGRTADAWARQTEQRAAAAVLSPPTERR